MYVNVLDTLLDALAELIGVGGPYNAVKIALYTNDETPSRTSELADFTITDFGGLTNLKTVTWSTPFANAAQQAEVLGGLLTWLTTGATGLPVTVYGYVMTDTAGTALILAERFAVPFEINAAGQSRSLVPRLVLNT